MKYNQLQQRMGLKEMANLPESVTALSTKYGFSRSAKYDQAWMFDNSMGPNPLWLVEWLTRDMSLTEDMVVLDMGCGKALTSIFLAREYGCTVFANDLWVSPDENLARINLHSLQTRVFPIHSEAHALPYSKNFFDTVVTVDAYQYFGTDDCYLDYFLKFIKPGGQIGIVVPGWSKEKTSPMPPGLEAFPAGEFTSFHTLDWWKKHFDQSEAVEIEKCDCLTDGKKIWMDSAQAMFETKKILRSADGTSPAEIGKELAFWGGDIEFLKADRGNFAGLMRIIMRKKEKGQPFRSLD
jgi:cyclopropane fatty-acyl-phospholipid synthase-like methyltransferase